MEYAIRRFIGEGSRIYLPLLLAIVSFFAFYKLGQHPIAEFDEARNGVNALEMLQDGDWWQLQYAGAPDTWNNKPPLLAWMIALGYQLFGVNAFGLRFFPALCIVLSVWMSYRIIRHYESPLFAFGACLLLVPIHGFIGTHTGRTADFEAPLILCLLTGTWAWLRAVDFSWKWGYAWAAFFTGLAFWVKGPAGFIFLPAWLGYAAYRRQLRTLLRSPQVYLGLVVGFVLLAGYFLSIINFAEDPGILQRAWLDDVLARFTDSDFERQNNEAGYLFFFVFMDAYFNVWNYLFFLLLLVGGIQWARGQWSLRRLSRQPLLVFSIWVWGTLALFFTLAATTHRWYLSPALPFLSITLVYWMRPWWRRDWFRMVVVSLLLFTFGRRLAELHRPDPRPAFVEQWDELLSATTNAYWVGGLPGQDKLLELYFLHPELEFIPSSQIKSVCREASEVIVVMRSDTRKRISSEGIISGCTLLAIDY